MSQSLHTAAVGMRIQQQNIDTIANNIANVNTTGFKKSRLDVADAAYSQMLGMSEDTVENNLSLGHGAIAAGQTTNFTQGNAVQTDRNLDLAIEGKGFFASENDDGSVSYTRNGSFTTRNVDGVSYLATINGGFVLDRNGQKIKVSFPAEQITISQDGTLSDGIHEPVAQIALYDFVNESGLSENGNSEFMATESSGIPILKKRDEIRVAQGMLENSNVDMAEEMTQLIRAQRAYSFLSRAINTADQMKGTENDIRR